jgi:arsenate reductase
VEQWCKEAGWESVLNRAGTTFRKLPDTDKAALTLQKAIGLMVAQPSIIKRPVLEHDVHVTIGFKPELYRNLKLI